MNGLNPTLLVRSLLPDLTHLCYLDPKFKRTTRNAIEWGAKMGRYSTFSKAVKAGIFALIVTQGSVAADFSFAGKLMDDEAIQFFQFQLNTQKSVVLQTLSFAGGVNQAGNVIANDGFAPILSLFDGSGSLVAADSGGVAPGGCGARNIDAQTGFCWDAYLNPNLNAGHYLLALTETDNSANGPFLTNGFHEQGNGNFTGPIYLGQPGSFILPTGEARTGNWAVDILGVNSASTVTTPEPAGALLIGTGLAGLALTRRRRAPLAFSGRSYRSRARSHRAIVSLRDHPPGALYVLPRSRHIPDCQA
jgi:hypothetical protein